ncbi:MAG: carboxypeptidase regulatory-like domain-containing protein [Pyrinomonadaceae bacterium]
MKNKISLFLFSLVLMLSLGNFERVLACICGRASTCERYNFAGVIFVGKAIAIEKETKGTIQTESTIFEIEELFSGENKQQIKVRNKSGFSCDVGFEQGKTYLVFAGGDKKTGFGTGFCSGNLPIEYADEELSNLRKLISSDEKGKLSGTILEKLEKRNKDENRVPVPNIQVNAREIDTGKTYNTFSDKTGRYEISVPAGNYKINLTVPEYAKIEYFNENEIFKVKNRGCAEGFYVLTNNNRITGKLIDSNGKPVSDIRVELLSLDEKEKSYLRGMSGETNDNGIFTIEEIPTGKYTLSVNYNSFPQSNSPFPTVFYPNSSNRENAMIFEIGLGQSIGEIVFRLPSRLTEKEIRGETFWEDGTPAKDVEIMLEDDEFRGFRTGCYMQKVSEESLAGSPVKSVGYSLIGLGCDLKTNKSGKFLLKGFSSRKYRIRAETEKIINGQKIDYEVESELFTVDENPVPLKLTLKKKSEKKDN